ncbi:MAG: ankyrin repeat domain-containing protein [Micavibrio sp.]|nr:ankyrin repeat domain-containing protein [Micavibrio sp.]
MKNRAKPGLSKDQQQALDRVMTGALKVWDETLIRASVESGADTQDLLVKAIARRSLPMAKLALQFGADANALVATSDARKYQPLLHYAHEHFNEEVFNLLLSNGVSIEARGPQNETVVAKAIKTGDFERMRFYATRGADLSPHVQDAFFKAIEKNDHTTLRWAVGQGADVHGRQRQADDGFATAMHIAFHHFNEDTVMLLLREGVSINARNTAGETALHGATRVPDVKKVECLLKNGADPLLASHANVTPLDEAMKHITTEDTTWRNTSYSSSTPAAPTVKDNAKSVLALMLGRVKEMRDTEAYSTSVKRDITAAKVITFPKPKGDAPGAP